MIVSFVFAFSAYAVNGYATQANARIVASRGPPNRSRRATSPRRASRSNAIDVACAAGSESHFPLHPKTSVAGTYARYETGPYVSPRSIAASQRPFVWMWSRTSPSVSAGPQGSRSPRSGHVPVRRLPVEDPARAHDPARPTSMTPRGGSRLRPTRKPSRNTAATASAHVGQTGRSGAARPRIPTQRPRARR